MRRLRQYLDSTQAQRTNTYQKQSYESRPDWAFVYPVRNKRESWQSDFCGVVRLTITNRRYWVSVWSNGIYRLRLSEKDGRLKTQIYRLSALGPDRYKGELLLPDDASSSQFRLRVHLRETDQRWLEIHFETISQKEDR